MCGGIGVKLKSRSNGNESWWELRSESLHESFLNSHGLVKTRTRVAWESWWELMRRTKVAWELMRVEKRVFTLEFSQLSWPSQTRTRVPWELLRSESLHESFFNSHGLVKHEQEYSTMRVVEKREFAWEFFQLSWPGQTRTRVARELTGYYCMRIVKTLIISHQNL
jgi:hypothetical protein